MFDGRSDCSGQTERRFVLSKVRIQLVQMPDLAIRTPSQIAISGFPKIQVRELLESARHVEAASEFVGERFVVDKAVCLGRVDRLLVETLGIQHATFQSGDLSTDKGGAVLEIFGAVFRPDSDLFVMRGQSLQMLPALIDRSGVIG